MWWKRHLTAAQIVQFSVGVPACAAALALRVRGARRSDASLPASTLADARIRHMQVNAEQRWGWFGGAPTHCRGTHRAAYVGIGLLFAYLVLFIRLYRAAYPPRQRRGTKAHAA